MFGWQGEALRIAQQQAAMRQSTAKRLAAEAMRVESLNALHQPAAPIGLEVITGQAPPTPGAMPAEVLAQLDSTRGRWGQWLPTVYSERERKHWWAEWLVVSPIGQEVAAEAKARAEARVAAEAAAHEARHQQAIQDRLQRELQERWRLPEGTVVQIKAPRSKFDGMLGRVRAMEWRGTELWARVMVDPLPPGHPLLGKPTRFRPYHLMPLEESFAAEMLRREHPEALG